MRGEITPLATGMDAPSSQDACHRLELRLLQRNSIPKHDVGSFSTNHTSVLLPAHQVPWTARSTWNVLHVFHVPLACPLHCIPLLPAQDVVASPHSSPAASWSELHHTPAHHVPNTLRKDLVRHPQNTLLQCAHRPLQQRHINA